VARRPLRWSSITSTVSAQGFPLFVGYGTFRRGAVSAMQGQGLAGLEQLRQGMATIVATGQEIFRPVCLVLLGEAAVHVGQMEEGLHLLVEALTALEATDDLLMAKTLLDKLS